MNKRTKYLCLVLITLPLIICFIFVYNTIAIKRIDVDNLIKINVNTNYCYEIKYNKNKKEIRGYIYKNSNEEVLTSEIFVILKNGNNYYKIPTYVIYDASKFGWTGFVSKSFVPNKAFNEDSYLFILINYNNKEELIDLGLKMKDL